MDESIWRCGNCGHEVSITEDLEGFDFIMCSSRLNKLGCKACGSYTIQQAYDHTFTAGNFLIVRSRIKKARGRIMDDVVIQKTAAEITVNINDQRTLCKSLMYPHFAPNNGICWKCHRNIYQNYKIGDHISKGYDGKVYVTGCQHCHKSYCD
jgi:hypothetical protein